MEKEKLETEKAAPSKVSGDLLSIPKKDFDKFLQEIKHSQQVQRREKYLDPYVDVQVMTTSERLLVGGSKTPPDTAPRLPPKPGDF